MMNTKYPGIIEFGISTLPAQVESIWREAGWVLKDTHIVDGRHLVLVFFVDHASTIMGTQVPREITKYVDSEEHAPYCAKNLKLATLRHYRECHQDLEGTGDTMEGRSTNKSNFDDFLKRHNVKSALQGAEHITTEVTYKTEDTSLIYCASRKNDLASQYKQWPVVSIIRDVPRFAVLLGAEFARQRDPSRHATVTGLEQLVSTAIESSELDSVVHVHHGAVVYNDNAGEVLFKKFPEHARSLAMRFFKGKAFEDQQEYRFVLSAPGRRPVQDEFFLRITPDLRRMFEKA